MAQRIQTLDSQGKVVRGEYNATLPTYTDGDVVIPQYDSRGRLILTVGSYATDDSAMPATPSIMPVGGEYRASATTYTDGDATVLQTDVNGNLKATLATLIAGEDLTNDVLKVEQRFSGSMVSADALIKSGAGFLHSLTFAQIDAAPTAGTIIVYDNTAESGTILYSETFDTTIFRGYSVILDIAFSTGLYIGFATTADVGVTPSYR
jgi:hypothetical protein